AGRLEEQRLRAVDLLHDAELALGRHDELVPELARLIAAEPYREHARAQHALALYRSGRQADALAACRAARGLLVAALGVAPAPASVHDPGLLGSALAQALGVSETGDLLEDALATELRDRSMLLLLDNLEQLVPRVELVSRLLAAAPRLLVLATSRTPLRLAG